jgi:membrane protease YdiL (CAAX protease family)
LSRLLPTAVLGGFAAYLRLRTGSLWPAILLHFVYNASLLLAVDQGWQWPKGGTIPAVIVTILGLAIVHNYMKYLDRRKSNG